MTVHNLRSTRSLADPHIFKAEKKKQEKKKKILRSRAKSRTGHVRNRERGVPKEQLKTSLSRLPMVRGKKGQKAVRNRVIGLNRVFYESGGGKRFLELQCKPLII